MTSENDIIYPLTSRGWGKSLNSVHMHLNHSVRSDIDLHTTAYKAMNSVSSDNSTASFES